MVSLVSLFPNISQDILPDSKSNALAPLVLSYPSTHSSYATQVQMEHNLYAVKDSIWLGY